MSAKPGWKNTQSAMSDKGGRGTRNRKFGGEMVAPKMPEPDRKRGSEDFDHNLLVGPLYEPKNNKADKIKEQIGDITAKLHNTLYAFDEIDEMEEEEDPLLRIMRDQIGGLSDREMQDKLNHFMDSYEHMHSQVNEAQQDRDEMLLQLADWFTTDHVDLDDIKSSMDDTDEESMKQSYFDTITNFEKIKKLQTQIVHASSKGKPTKQLQNLKHRLENDVVDKFKVMKDMSMQTMKLKVSDDAPWKYAANEIVHMLKNVRAENADEVSAITKKMQEMVDQLEKQALRIKSLTAELREKKEVMLKLTDENSDLSQDVAVLRARYVRYERDLESAKQMIRTLHKEKANMEGTDAPPAPGTTLAASISKVLGVFEEPVLEVKPIPSDPAILRTTLRQYQDALESIKAEYSRVADENEELKVGLQEKKEYINNMEAENEKLTKDIRKMRQERRQSIAAGVITPAAGDGHKCEHCKCHVPEKDIDEEIEGLKKEVKQWQDKTTYFKKLLADTEMKLSDAFKEISDLRMDRDVPMAPPPSVSEPQPPSSEPTEGKSSNQKPEKNEQEKAPKAAPKPKPRPGVKARYLESQPKQPPKLPPIDKSTIEQKIEEQLPTGLSPKQSRELKLYKAGDLQGRMNMLLSEIIDFVTEITDLLFNPFSTGTILLMNMLLSEIMEFVTEIGRMLYTEKDDEGGKIQQMKAFTFDNSPGQRQREVRDPVEEEAKQRKSQVVFNGQHACAKLRDSYDMLSNYLNLKHDEHEAIYRSFKISQQRNMIRREVMMGRMPMSSLRDFDKQTRKTAGPDSLLNVYFNISYGGGPANLLGKTAASARQGSGLHTTSSTYSLSGEESEAKLKNTINVLGIQRSKSDLDTHETGFGAGSLFGEGLGRERANLYVTTTPEHSARETLQQGSKQEMRLGVAGLAKKGLIHLSTNEDDTHLPADNFSIHGERQKSGGQEYGGPSQKTKSLIKRKDIIEQIRMGTKLLEEEEAAKLQEEQITKSLGDYTILDLQSKILEMTDSKSVRRGTPTGTPDPQLAAMKRKEPQQKNDKPITLPAIKNLNPFSMKTK